MQRIMAMRLCAARQDGTIHVEPGDPDWFYALPIGLNGSMEWAMPAAADLAAWKQIASEKFLYPVQK